MVGMPAFSAAVIAETPSVHCACMLGWKYPHIPAKSLALSWRAYPSIAAPGEPWPGGACAGAWTVTPWPSVAAQDGAEGLELQLAVISSAASPTPALPIRPLTMPDYPHLSPG